MNSQPLGADALELDVHDVMTAGVITVDEDATLEEAVQVMAANRIHAVLVVGIRSGTALGWVTTRGLLAHVGGAAATRVTDAITEEAKTIVPDASVRTAIYALSFPDVSRLLVRRRGSGLWEGVVTEYDVTVGAIDLSRRRGSPRAAA
jgi:predicted transcriptional regulator